LDAIVPLAAAIGLGTNAYRASYLLGQALVEAGSPVEAITYLDRALEMKPDYKSARELRNLLAAKR
jgi:predicted Zn-dependent protease